LPKLCRGAHEGQRLLTLDRVLCPLESLRCESGSLTSLGETDIDNRPTADVSVFTALKSTIMKWSGVMPVTSLTVSMVQPGSRPACPRLVLKRTFSACP